MTNNNKANNTIITITNNTYTESMKKVAACAITFTSTHSYVPSTKLLNNVVGNTNAALSGVDVIIVVVLLVGDEEVVFDDDVLLVIVVMLVVVIFVVVEVVMGARGGERSTFCSFW